MKPALMLRSVLAVAVVFLLAAFAANTAFADEDYYIPVPEGFGVEKYPSIAEDEKVIVGNGFAIEWPAFSKEGIIATFPKYYEDLFIARQGAELVNKLAFNIYKKITDDGENTLYFSPYGVYTALWDYYATSDPDTQNKIFKNNTHEPITKLKKFIYENFTNKMTKKEEITRLYGDFEMINKVLNKKRASSFKVSNGISTSDLFPYLNEGNVGLALTNSTDIEIRFLATTEESLFDGVWQAGKVLYAQTDEYELMRVKFKTLKHSLLLINPKKSDNIKEIEQEMDIKTIKDQLCKMQFKNVVFRLSGDNFGGTYINKYGAQTFDFNPFEITGDTKLITFSHSALFMAAHFIETPMPWNILQEIRPESFSGMYDVVLSLDRPFLFFIIDDPTGVILIMGRSNGYGVQQ